MNPIIWQSAALPNGETLTFRERPGAGGTVLLIHGNMTSSAHWDIVMEQFDPAYRLIAVDLRGFGGSTYNRPIDSIADFADDVRQFADAIGLGTFALVGWSMGGGVAMSLTADVPDRVEKLVLLASLSTRGYPFISLDSDGKLTRRLKTRAEIAADPTKAVPVARAYAARDKAVLRAIWEALIYTDRRPEPERYERYLEDMLTQRNIIDVYDALNMFNISAVHNGVAPGSGRAARITAPTLVLSGDRDRVVLPSMVEEIVADIGANARRVILANCGHSPLIDDAPQLMARLHEFLAEPAGGR